MKYNKLGATNLDISLIGLGTMTFGEQTSKDEAFKIMDYAFDKGINFFDTAEMYPVYPRKETQGLSEVIIGEWINSRKIREKIIIGTKISSSHPKGIGYTKLSWIYFIRIIYQKRDKSFFKDINKVRHFLLRNKLN